MRNLCDFAAPPKGLFCVATRKCVDDVTAQVMRTETMQMNARQDQRGVAGAPFVEAEYVRAMDAVLARPEVKFINAFVGIAEDFLRWRRAR